MRVTFKQQGQRGWFIGEWGTAPGNGGDSVFWKWWRPLRLRDLPFFIRDRLRLRQDFGPSPRFSYWWRYE